METGAIQEVTGTANALVSSTVNLNGGLLRLTGATGISASIDTVNINSGGANIEVGDAVSSIAAAALLDGGGGGGLTKTGDGSLDLSGINTFTGPVSVNAGNLTISNYGGLDANSSLITVAGGNAGLNLQMVGTGATSDSYAQNLSLNGFLRGTGGSSGNTLSVTWSGNVTLGGSGTINPNGNTSFDIDGQVNLGA
ncbi:MAG: autotransporter-associated beta strand repeat-containing protein, partial [Akkermansiaceae bacterium]|nr:autotransporter-associated beta strand repeat-containing protein [Akkermansiaceae bacterium]